MRVRALVAPATVLAVVLLGAMPAARQTTAPRAAALSPEEAERFLREAEIVASKPIGKGVTKPWRLTLRLGDLTRDAAFQSIDRLKENVRFKSGRFEREFRDFYGYNIAAYQLARVLGYDDLVPVSVERRWRGNTGALTWWVEKKWDEDERLKAGIDPPDAAAWERQVYLARVFTALVEDTDRNLGNQLVTADFHLWMIDFTRAFRHSTTIKSAPTLYRIDRRLYERLQTLADDELSKAVSRWVEPAGVMALLARRKALVAHFAGLVAARGEKVVLIE